MKIAIIGRGEILYDTITQLKKAGHDIVVIITCAAPEDYVIKTDDFKHLARKLKVPFFLTEKINTKELIATIMHYKAEIGVSINWRDIIQKEVLQIFKYGVINAHAGDVPRYKGNAAPNWALLNGEKKIALTLHRMTEKLDSGPVLLKRYFEIGTHTNIGDIHDFLQANTPEMYIRALTGIKNNTIKAIQQSRKSSATLRVYPRFPRDGEINWESSAIKIDRLIRASSRPLAGAYTFMGLTKIIIWKAHTERSATPFCAVAGQVVQLRHETGEVAIAAKDGFVVLEDIQIEGQSRCAPATAIKSIRIRLGMDVTHEILKLNTRIAEIEKALRINRKK